MAHPIFVIGLHAHRLQCHMRVLVPRAMRQDDAKEEPSPNHLEPDSWFYLN